jgi:hypothetical protein
VRKKRQQFTGGDYLIGTAADRPDAHVFDAMIKMHLMRTPVAGFEGISWNNPTEWAARRDLTPNEEAALFVYGDALLRAIQNKDMQSVRELASWGAGMLLRFNDFQKHRMDGDEPHHKNEEE